MTDTTVRASRCAHGKHILFDPPCSECVKEIEAFRRRCAELDYPTTIRPHSAWVQI
jgi:hypothetical protein